MTLHIDPVDAPLDAELHIAVRDVAPGAEVTLTARERDARGRTWASAATYVADDGGEIDLRRDAPVSGSYAGVDPMGLIWSMRTPDRPTVRTPDLLAATALDVTATGGQPVRVTRRRVAAHLTSQDVNEDGLVGVVWRPDDDRVRPGILLLGGSEGGLHSDDAALLAAHGFVVLALAYYGLPGLPTTLVDVPLEYFRTAIDYLSAHHSVDAARIGVTGGSKGGEASLLIAATFPQIRAVVSVVGSGIITQGISQNIFTGNLAENLATPVPNWTWHGEPLPFLANVLTDESRDRIATGRPFALRMAFTPGLALADKVAAATIPVERINGPVLLLSTADDEGYGPAFHDVAAQRLDAHALPYQHIVYPDAGHLIAAPPYGPTFDGDPEAYGGTAAGTARARADAWRRMLAFFETSLR